MADPLDWRVLAAYVEALSRVVQESYLSYDAANQNKSLNIQASGVFSGTFPRKFELEIVAIDQIQVTELTTAFTGFTPLAPYTVTVVSEVPFAITGTDIEVTASYDLDGVLTVGDKYLLRLGKATTTLKEVAHYAKSMNAVASPGAVVHGGTLDEDKKKTVGAYEDILTVTIVYMTDRRAKDPRGLRQDLACIENELNRDHTMGGLCKDTHINRVEIFDGDGSEMIGAQITCTAEFRHLIEDKAQPY